MISDQNHLKAKGYFWNRMRSTVFLLPAWFAPHKSLRVFFHRLRGVHIGRHVEIGYYCIIGNVHPSRVHIGNSAVITANSVILEHDNSYYYTCGRDVKFGDVYIGDRAFVGIGAIVMPGVSIGTCAIVGALSVVKCDVPAYSVVAGQPAKVIKQVPESVPFPECRTASIIRSSPAIDSFVQPQ